MTRTKLARYLGIYTMAVMFLPILIKNIPSPLNIITGTTLLLGAYWVLIIFYSHPKILFHRYLSTIYISVFIYFLGSLTVWDGLVYSSVINLKWIILDFFGAFLSIMMYMYFLMSRDYKGLAIVSLSGLLFIFITSITSSVSLSFYPEAVRQLSSGSAGQNDALFGKLGIPGYTYWASLVYLIPVIVYFVKDKYLSKTYKRLSFLVLVVILLSLVQAQITTALVLAFLFMIFSLLNRGNLRASGFIIIIVSVSSLFLLNTYIANLFYYASELSNSELLRIRLYDVGQVLELQDYYTSDGDTYFSQSRLSRIAISLENFLLNPIYGGGKSGGHSTWLDKLGVFGLIGILPWIIIFIQQSKFNLRYLGHNFRSTYLLAVISCIILGILTTTANSPHSGIVIFFIVPGLFYTKYLRKVR